MASPAPPTQPTDHLPPVRDTPAGSERQTPPRHPSSSGLIRRAQIKANAALLVVCSAVLLASLLLEVRDSGGVAVPGLEPSLPGSCLFQRLTGWDCPGCGLTRCFISLAHGRPRQAAHYNPAGIVFFAVVLLQIPLRSYQLLRLKRGQPALQFHQLDQWLLIGLALVLLVQWFVRLTN